MLADVRKVDSVHAVAALDDPQRARLYSFVRTARAPVTREEAAAGVGISRKLAAFHLDRLVDAGLLAASFDRPQGDHLRIGRAPKRYVVADVDVTVSIPERSYDFVGEILVDAIAETGHGESPSAAAARVARERGRALGAGLREERRLGRVGPERGLGVVTEVLVDLGFEPAATDEGLVQRNCPFHRLAQRSPELVCGVNCEFVEGLLEGLETSRLHATLAPANGRCCVVVKTD
jgi:predicted ArsR family transcriptional regulator